jgi:hypothetical protein
MNPNLSEQDMKISEQLKVLQSWVINNDRNSQMVLVNLVGVNLLLSDDFVSNHIIKKTLNDKKI